MKLYSKFIMAFSALMISGAVGHAQEQKKVTREEYIATYAPIAMQHQKIYGIPASIKIAQGIIESQYGNSSLSLRSNNHFGIKCKSYWQGDTVVYDDDAIGECFRSYKSVEDSYVDHSEFLRSGSRYASLFDLDPTDYKGWAHGLKAAGYATAPHYANSLIKCIEDHELYLLDDGEMPVYLAEVKPLTVINTGLIDFATEPIDLDDFTVYVMTVNGHNIFMKEDGKKYVIARSDETYRTIANRFGLTEKKLRRFNNKDKKAVLKADDIVYIEKQDKKKRS